MVYSYIPYEVVFLYELPLIAAPSVLKWPLNDSPSIDNYILYKSLFWSKLSIILYILKYSTFFVFRVFFFMPTNPLVEYVLG
jgi:hypothetical protein